MLHNPTIEFFDREDVGTAMLSQGSTARPSKHHNKKKVTKQQRNKRNRVAKQSRRKNRK